MDAGRRSGPRRYGGGAPVLDRLKLDAEYCPCDIGWEFWCKEGNALPDRTVKALKETTCGLFGAITSKPQSEAKEELIPELKGKVWSIFAHRGLRQMFNLHTNMRPCKSYPGNPLNYRGNKITNPSGETSRSIRWCFVKTPKGVTAASNFSIARIGLHRALCQSQDEEVEGKGIRKCGALYSHYEQARLHEHLQTSLRVRKKDRRKRVTLIEKPNVLRETGGLMMRCFRDVAKNYPDIRADDANIDAICMWMFKNPQDYSVLVAENMFGDIVSDLCAGLVGGLGFAPSANLGDNYAVFEPTHGSAPKYAGQYKVNPIAMLLTAKLMLDWLKETEMANRLETAIARVISEGKVRTYDMGGKNSTLEVAKAIADYASA
jgi:3-isopropylmalate dehydrogenase